MGAIAGARRLENYATFKKTTQLAASEHASSSTSTMSEEDRLQKVSQHLISKTIAMNQTEAHLGWGWKCKCCEGVLNGGGCWSEGCFKCTPSPHPIHGGACFPVWSPDC